jgi:hypothetical protein
MTKEEIEQLKTEPKRPSMLWAKAFAEYTRDTGKKLGMSCQPCFYTVLNYHVDKLA